VARVLAIQDAIVEAGLALPVRERAFESLDVSSQGFAGLRRCDITVNLQMPGTAEGLALLAGIAACARDAPGKCNAFWDRELESVFFRGRSGRCVLGRWYDKSVEANLGARGTVIRGEDQRRWSKGHRRDPAELDAGALKAHFQRRFYPLYKATKGVTVGGPMAIAAKVIEAMDAGELSPQRGRLLIADTVLEGCGAERKFMKDRTLRRSRSLRAELGLVLADGVLEEVEVELGEVLEAVLDTDAWERRG
jgi:hypothetical protein